MVRNVLVGQGKGHLIRCTEDVCVILLEAPQPRQAPQTARGLRPVQGPEVRQSQGQLPPGSGPVGEHQAEGGGEGSAVWGTAAPEHCSSACQLAALPGTITAAFRMASVSCQSHSSPLGPCLAPRGFSVMTMTDIRYCAQSVTGAERKQELRQQLQALDVTEEEAGA